MKRSMIIGLAAVLALACSKKKDDRLTIPLQPVSRQTIVVSAEATGVVEPINVIEVKAKSSGQIVAMPVETGSFVKAGDLLVQLDTRDTRNSFSQAKADLDAATVSLRVSKQAKDRADALFKERIITSVEHEQAQVGYANAQATVLRNRAALDIRLQNLQEATVRAPVAGTVISKDVALGQVIASGTGSFGGGTTILKMADLTKVRVRTLVNETDIGKVRAGLAATVVVDAFPDRPFVGTVEKIEPQATVQQSVTMFPVLVSIDNQARLLMPGMNGQVSIEVERRENVLAIGNEAIRSPNEVASVAALLGLNADSVSEMLRSQGGGQRGDAGQNGTPVATSSGNPQQAELVSNPIAQGGQGGQAGQGQRGGSDLPDVTDKQCQAVTAAMSKHPEVQTRIADLRARVTSGELDRQAMQAETKKIYSAIGLEADVARACNFRQRNAGQDGGARADARAGGGNAGGSSAGGGAQARGSDGASGPRNSAATGAGQPAVGQSGAAQSGGAQSGGGNAARGGRAGGRRGLVFVSKDGKYDPRMVRLGVSNFDYTEVLSGVKEGEQVAVLNVAMLQAQGQEDLNRIRNRAGVPGMQRQQPTGGAAGAGARPGGGTGGQR